MVWRRASVVAIAASLIVGSTIEVALERRVGGTASRSVMQKL
jgi:hypothetical protein